LAHGWIAYFSEVINSGAGISTISGEISRAPGAAHKGVPVLKSYSSTV
jgi:hypothetical protein